MPTDPNPAYETPAYTKTPITGDRLKYLDPASVRQLWKAGVEVHEQACDFWSDFEGNDPLALIQTETNTSKGAGQKIVFTNRSGLYAEPHLGDERFTDSSHYEELLIGHNELTVDWFRHGVEYTERAEELMGMRGELAAGLPEELGRWAGRLKSEKIFMMLREQIPAENVVELNGVLNWNAIVTHAQIMKRWGAASAMVGRQANGKPLRRYVVVAAEDALTSLKLDGDYKEALQNTTQPQGKMFFEGGYTDVDGHVIRPYDSIEHDGYGAIGSPMNPMARLGVAMTAVNLSAVNHIHGGGSDRAEHKLARVKTMKYFPGYAYPVQAGVTLPASTQDFYVAVINPPNAAMDPGKYGLYKVGPVTADGSTQPANDGNKLCIKAALAIAQADPTDDTHGAAKVNAANGLGPGSPAWDSAKHTNNHPVDALVVLVNSDGTARFCSHILGAAAARRGYGKYRNNRTFQNKEGNFVREVYFNTVMGQTIRTNRRGRAPGVITVWHKGILAGTPLPVPA